MNRLLIIVVAATALVSIPRYAFAEDPTPSPAEAAPAGDDSGADDSGGETDGPRAWIQSAYGPDAGEDTIAMGGRILVFVPFFDLNYLHGLHDILDFDLHLTTLGFLNFAEVGVRLRPVRGPDFSLAIRANASSIFFFVAIGGTATFATIGTTPGLEISFGGDDLQFTIHGDIMFILAATGSIDINDETIGGSGSRTVWFASPGMSIEFPVGDTTNMYVRIDVLIYETGTFIGPFIAVGASW